MEDTLWASALETVKGYTFKISTPNSMGTGFLITKSFNDILAVATAYHVISHAYEWEDPIKLLHSATNKQIVLKSPDRFIFVKKQRDVAVIMFQKEDLKIAKKILTISPEGKFLRPGIQIGWAGYPAIAPEQFSFFSGCVSCLLEREEAYLVDGVAINGVSGGPAFTVFSNGDIHIIGLVSAYIPNRVTGESLPGVCFVASIMPFYDFIKGIKSLDEARKKSENEIPEANKQIQDNSKNNKRISI
jgi:hypothetical protein